MESSIKIDPKRFWGFVRQKKFNRLSETQVFKMGDETYRDGSSVASAFAKYFRSVYSTASPLNIDTAVKSPVMQGVQLLDIRRITLDEVISAIKRLPSKRSFGPDLIPPYIFKACSEFLVKPLCHIFNLSLSRNKFPTCWKTTRILPLHKKGDKFEISNFRPVAILSTPAKVFELILHSHIFFHMKSYITPFQHGFFPARSIVTNLANFINFTSATLDKKGQVDVVYTDFSKAFDTVDHTILLSKLNYYGFSDDLLKFFYSYLDERMQYVSRGGYKSDLFQAFSGVPQGSNLGPLLFNIFINDIVTFLSCNVLMYADDLKLFSSVKHPQDCVNLQNNLNIVSRWCVTNKLRLNISKCFTMSFYRINNPVLFPYQIDQVMLERVEQFTDLGVIMSRELCFSDHILSTVKKAYCTLGFIFRLGKLFKETDTLKLLFFSLVRSRLEFCSVIWSPSTTVMIKLIEQVQKKFLRMMYYKTFSPFNYPIWSIRYNDMLVTFEIESLEIRRKLARLCFLRGVMVGQVDDAGTLAEVRWYVPGYGGRVSRLLYPRLTRTAQHAASYLNASVALFNQVADAVDIADSLAIFKINCLNKLKCI